MQQSKFGKKKMGGDFALGQESIFSGPTLQLELEIPPLLKKVSLLNILFRSR